MSTVSDVAIPAVVLLVEDNPNDRELTLAALRGVHAHVLSARDGVEALDYLFGRGSHAGQPPVAPTLVLLDLKLPLVNGLQVLEAMRRDSLHANTRVVVLTSSDEERDQARCRQLGVTDYLRKEVNFALFREQVRELWPTWTRGAERQPARSR